MRGGAQNPPVRLVSPRLALLARIFVGDNSATSTSSNRSNHGSSSSRASGSCAGSVGGARNVLPITPTFVLPYKRYASCQLTRLARGYLGADDCTLREAVSSRDRPIYDDQIEEAFSHTTLWRFVTYLGLMTASLMAGLRHYQQAEPESQLHHSTGQVAPAKYRSDSRAHILRQAHRLLELISRWEVRFPNQRFFPGFATRVRPP